jgi:hypothetical protein
MLDELDASKTTGVERCELIHCLGEMVEAVMAGQPGFFDLSDRYEALSAAGDPLERLSAVVDFEVFRGPLVAALRRGARNKDGRPPFDPVLMFKALVLQALYSLSDEATEFQIKDRLSFQRFLGLGLDGTVPDATTVWLFRERLVKARAIDRLFVDPRPPARCQRQKKTTDPVAWVVRAAA